jgi:Rrf2 family protein
VRLQKNTLLALYSVLEFAAQPARQLSVTDLAASLRASPHHLAKVLRTLGRAGLVDSVRGAHGGYRFAANARRTTLMDVIALFEDISAPAPRARRARRPAEHALGQVLGEIDQTARATFGSVTLDTMLKLTARHGRG